MVWRTCSIVRPLPARSDASVSPSSSSWVADRLLVERLTGAPHYAADEVAVRGLGFQDPAGRERADQAIEPLANTSS